MQPKKKTESVCPLQRGPRPLEPFPEKFPFRLAWIANTRLHARCRTTRPSSAGDTVGGWGWETHHPGATVSTVLAQHAPLTCLSCRPHVSSLMFLLSACRDGNEPPCSRPGGWEDRSGRQRWPHAYMRATGNIRIGGLGGGDLRNGAMRPHAQIAVATQGSPGVCRVP